MRATAFEFRLRMVIMVALISLGFWSPWIESLGVGRRITLLEWLALEISRVGILPFTASTPAVIVFATLIAAVGAALRIWGTAYLGSGTVNHLRMQAGALMADGPYRFVRNPLYLGTAFMFVAMAFIMPPTGAALSLCMLFAFMFRLILGEEAFLQSKLGAPYDAYRAAVPRLFPRLCTSLPATGSRPHWATSVLSEINPIGVFLTLAVFSWRYDHWIMIRAILISLGLSLIVRALMPQGTKEPTATA